MDNYDSFDFKTRFTTIGDFIITAPITKKNLQRLAKGNIISLGNSAGYIETVQLDEGTQKSRLTAVGYDLKGFLSQRINWGVLNYSGTVEGLFRKLVDGNCINTLKERVIPFLELGNVNGFKEKTERNNEGACITDLMSTVSNFYKIGWRIDFKPKEKKLIFNTFKGVDRTVNQTVVTTLVFEKKRENILEQLYVDSNEGHKNVAYVAGEKVDEKRTTVSIVGNASGFERRETFIEATSQRINENSEAISEQDYIKLITAEGKQALAENAVIKNFDCIVNTKNNLDFEVGDMCTVVENEWGILINTYINEIEQIYDVNGFTLNIVFGDDITNKKGGIA